MEKKHAQWKKTLRNEEKMSAMELFSNRFNQTTDKLGLRKLFHTFFATFAPLRETFFSKLSVDDSFSQQITAYFFLVKPKYSVRRQRFRKLFFRLRRSKQQTA